MKIYAKDTLRIHRAKSGNTISSLSEHLSITKQTYGKIERRAYAAGATTAQEICQTLGVEFDEVFEIVEKQRG